MRTSTQLPLLATTNQIKIEEFEAFMGTLETIDIGGDEPQTIDPSVVVRHKLEAARSLYHGRAIVVEDTALHLTGWNGLPGALIKSFVSELSLTELYKAFSSANPSEAVATSSVGILYEGTTVIWKGSLRGQIVPPRGLLGGWTPLFEVRGTGRTLGEMAQEERLRLTMRRGPIMELQAWLKTRQ